MHRPPLSRTTPWLALAAVAACGGRADLPVPAGAGGLSTGSSTTSSSGGGGGACAPGEVVTCYDGPPGTAGIGICRSGLSACAVDGSGLGPCAGQQLPGPDDCTTPEDEDCDGAAAPCLGLCWWSRSMGGTDYDFLEGAAALPSGEMVLTGNFSTPIDLGGVILGGPKPSTFVAAMLAADGTTAWGKGVGSPDSSGAVSWALPATGAGRLVLAGNNFYGVDLGAGPLASGAFLAELTPGGSLLFAAPLIPAEPMANIMMGPVAAAADGSLRVLVTAHSPFVFGDTIVSAGPDDKGLTALLILDALGAPVTAAVMPLFFGDGNLAANDSGVAVVTGVVGSPGKPIVRAFAPDGLPLFTSTAFSEVFGVGAVAVDDAGNVFVTGEMHGPTDLGGGVVGTSDDYQVFVTALDPAGAHRWDRVFSQKDATLPYYPARSGALAVGAAGDLVVTGQFAGTTDLGAGPVASNGETDVFVVSLSLDDGALRWARTFGGEAAESVVAVDLDAAGRLRLAGHFFGTFDAGCGPLVSTGGVDVFVVALLP